MTEASNSSNNSYGFNNFHSFTKEEIAALEKKYQEELTMNREQQAPALLDLNLLLSMDTTNFKNAKLSDHLFRAVISKDETEAQYLLNKQYFQLNWVETLLQNPEISPTRRRILENQRNNIISDLNKISGNFKGKKVLVQAKIAARYPEAVREAAELEKALFFDKFLKTAVKESEQLTKSGIVRVLKEFNTTSNDLKRNNISEEKKNDLIVKYRNLKCYLEQIDSACKGTKVLVQALLEVYGKNPKGISKLLEENRAIFDEIDEKIRTHINDFNSVIKTELLLKNLDNVLSDAYISKSDWEAIRKWDGESTLIVNDKKLKAFIKQNSEGLKNEIEEMKNRTDDAYKSNSSPTSKSRQQKEQLSLLQLTRRLIETGWPENEQKGEILRKIDSTAKREVEKPMLRSQEERKQEEQLLCDVTKAFLVQENLSEKGYESVKKKFRAYSKKGRS